MENIGDISSWLTPAIIIGLFLWLRADIRALEGRFEKRVGSLEEQFEKRFDGVDKRFDGVDKRFDAVDKRFDAVDKRLDGFDERLRAVEASQAEIKGQLSFVRDYVLSRNLQAPEPATEGAPGD